MQYEIKKNKYKLNNQLKARLESSVVPD